MNKSVFCFFLCALIVAVGAVPSSAATSTDYPCLNSCIKSGKSSADCMSQCTHDELDHNPRVQSRTDYRCLDICKGAGKSAKECMTQCTYTDTPDSAAASHPTTSGGAALANHEILEAPVPAGNQLITKPKISAGTSSAKNYNCINQCLHDGMQYQLCNSNCSAVTPGFNN